jgi:rod shape-determining protein MreC
MKLTRSRTLQTIVLAMVVIGLIALALGGYLTPVSRYLLSPVIVAQTWLSTRFSAIQNYLSSPQDITRLRDRNTALEAEVSRLQTEIIALKQQIDETRVLSALVDFARVNPEYRYVAASVIGRDPSPFLQYAIINRGSDDGLRRGMPVVTQQGLVGRIAAVTAGAARVQFITDPGSSINVRIEPSRAPAVLQGDITGNVSLDMIPQSAKIQINDLVMTSGLGGNYPPDIVIGQVTGVRSRDNDLFQRASVQPIVDFNQLEILMIITNFRPVETAPLTPTSSAP